MPRFNFHRLWETIVKEEDHFLEGIEIKTHDISPQKSALQGLGKIWGLSKCPIPRLLKLSQGQLNNSR